MKPFDVFHWQPTGWPGPHPCVIVSHPSRVANKPEVNVLMCSTKRATRKPEAHEVVLDTADGMDWPTLLQMRPAARGEQDRPEVPAGSRVRGAPQELVRASIAALGWGEVLAG